MRVCNCYLGLSFCHSIHNNSIRRCFIYFYHNDTLIRRNSSISSISFCYIQRHRRRFTKRKRNIQFTLFRNKVICKIYVNLHILVSSVFIGNQYFRFSLCHSGYSYHITFQRSFGNIRIQYRDTIISCSFCNFYSLCLLFNYFQFFRIDTNFSFTSRNFYQFIVLFRISRSFILTTSVQSTRCKKHQAHI